MKKLFLFLAWVAASASMGAPVYPFPVTVTQSDGSELTVIGHGDEDHHYYTTADNVLLVHSGSDYYIGAVDKATGELTATRQLAHEVGRRSPAEQQLASAQDIDRFLASAEQWQRRNAQLREPIAATGSLFPHTGSPKAIVILAEFTDTVFALPDPRASFDQYLNRMGSWPEDLGGSEDLNYSSVRHYYRNMSRGQFEPQFDVYGPVKLPNPLKYYGGTKSDGAGENMSALVGDACRLLDDEIDFSQYDSNEDGNVDLVFIVYAGYMESITGNSAECIWPKSGTVSIADEFDGKKVVRYGVSGELNGFPGAFSSAPYKRINGIGVFCHEFAHCLGLPDLYPTTKSVKGDNQGMEYWSLMDLGEYLYNGWAPSEFTAWERECFGWIDIEELDPSQALDIQPLSAGGKAYRISNEYDPTNQEYYILENVQQTGFNWSMKGHGLVVTHVNYDASAFSRNNVNNTKGKPRMTVIPADGVLYCNTHVNGTTVKNADFYAQLAGDPFPGTSDVREVDVDSDLPNLPLWVTGEASVSSSMKAPSATGDAVSRLCYALSHLSEDESGTIHLNEGVTGIRDLPTTAPATGIIYTTDGRIVGRDPARLHKGIYVRDGKKIVIGGR